MYIFGPTRANSFELPSNAQPTTELIIKANTIDLKKDYIHLLHLCSQNNKKPTQVFQQIEALQKKHQEHEFNQLKKEFPVLVEFEQLSNMRQNAKGYKAAQLTKMLISKHKEIIANQLLSTQLQNKLPSLVNKIKSDIRNSLSVLDIENS